MSRELICPHCGGPVPLGEPPVPGSSDSFFSSEVAPTVETVLPRTAFGEGHRPGPGGSDAPAAPTEGDARPAFPDDAGGAGPPSRVPWDAPKYGSLEFDPLSVPAPDPLLEAFMGDESPLGTPPTDRDSLATRLRISTARAESGGIQGSSQDRDLGGRSWPHVLLRSYASAVTIGLAYLLWTGHKKEAPDPATPASAPLPDPARGKPGPAPIAENFLTSLGRPLRVGSLELTPLSIKTGTVRLEFRKPGGSTRRSDGGSALILRLRLRNVSPDQSFAPLDRSFVRPADSGLAETFIETGESPIEPYPLALASERAIVGQSFEPIPPGGTVESIVVSDRDPARALTPGMTWRVKLRVAPEKMATVGVAFSPNDVR